MVAQIHRKELLQASVTSVAASTPSVGCPVAVGHPPAGQQHRNGKFRPNGALMVISVPLEIELGGQLPSGGERPMPAIDPKYPDFQQLNGTTTASKREFHVCCWWLPAILSTTAGAVDVIGFLVFGGLFTAHITGNLVVVAAHYVTGGFGQVGPVLAVPVFVAALGLVVLLFGGIENKGRSRRALLVLHAALLAGCLGLGITCGPFRNVDSPVAVLAGMLAVTAMATQNALVKLALVDSPSTAVMTTNTTQFIIDVAALVRVAEEPEKLWKFRRRARVTFLCMAGFVGGCVIGAVFELHFGVGALALPVILAALAVPLGEQKGRINEQFQ
jgi:uncharacterized membrane protein YoaK (UPF0700 family)